MHTLAKTYGLIEKDTSTDELPGNRHLQLMECN